MKIVVPVVVTVFYGKEFNMDERYQDGMKRQNPKWVVSRVRNTGQQQTKKSEKLNKHTLCKTNNSQFCEYKETQNGKS